jgi:hypothetical protein
MPQRPKRETVDLSAYPDLVVIYLGMRVNTITGIKTVLGFGAPHLGGRRCQARWPATTREHSLLASPRRDAPVLA